MVSYLLVAAVASGQLSFADGTITWYEPADGVPLSGLESAQACESRGQRLCLYDELCPSGEDTASLACRARTRIGCFPLDYAWKAVDDWGL